VESSMLKSLSVDSGDSGEYFLADSEQVDRLEAMHAQYGPDLSLARCREGQALFETIVAEAQGLGLKTKADLMDICDAAQRDSGKCLTTSGTFKRVEVWKSLEVVDMLLKCQAVCHCLETDITLIQSMGDAIIGQADQLQDISGSQRGLQEPLMNSLNSLDGSPNHSSSQCGSTTMTATIGLRCCPCRRRT